MRRLCLAFFASVACLIRGDAATIREFPFEFRDGLLWAEVHSPRIRRPMNFLVDTGAGATVLDIKVAKQLGLRLGRRVEVQGVKARIAGYWLRNVNLEIGEAPLSRRCLAIDLSKLSGSCERQVDGLIGADFFKGGITQIDFSSSKIRTLDEVQASLVDSRIPLQVRSCGMRVPISVNGGAEQLVRLDTGCASALQWVTAAVPEICSKNIAIGLAEVAIPQIKTAVRFGGIGFEDVLTGIHRTRIFPGEYGLLGNGLLSRFSSIIIDAPNGELLLQASAPK